MQSDPIQLMMKDDEIVQAEQRTFDAFVIKGEEYMRLLFEAGFAPQTILEMGIHYLYTYRQDPDWCANMLYAARVVRVVAINLHIDLASHLNNERR